MGSPLEDKEIVSLIYEIFREKVPFNKWLDLKIESVGSSGVKISFDMRPELLGNPKRGMLHGGVVSAVLDAAGGLAVFVSLIEKMQVKTLEETKKVARSFSTIDLRIDYLRPGVGKTFFVAAHPLRAGKKLVVIRGELHNDQHDLIAVGIGSYLVV